MKNKWSGGFFRVCRQQQLLSAGQCRAHRQGSELQSNYKTILRTGPEASQTYEDRQSIITCEHSPDETPDQQSPAWLDAGFGALLRGFSLCRRWRQTVRHHISSCHLPFPSRSASCCPQENLKIELSIKRWARRRWDSNRRSGGLIIVIYPNQHFETSVWLSVLWKWAFSDRRLGGAAGRRVLK